MSPRRRVDPRRIKIHRSYTIEQLAKLLDCHKNSVRLWIKQGLQILDDGKRPFLIQGSVAKRFLEAKRQVRKRRCKPHELYCLRCQEPRLPVDRRALYRITPGQAGLLMGACSECATQMFKRVSASSASALQSSLTLQIYEAEETPKLAA